MANLRCSAAEESEDTPNVFHSHTTFVDLDGESHSEQVEAKLSRREREREAPSEEGEGEEIKSPKRKVIRVESEETQDYVKEAKSTEHEEEEEKGFSYRAR